MQNLINFDSKRTISDIIKDSLFFTKNYWIQLFKVYIVIVGPMALISSFFQIKLNWILLQNGLKYSDELASTYFVFYLFAFLTMGLSVTTVLIFVKQYIKNGIEYCTVDILGKLVWLKIIPIIGASLFSGIVMFLGFLLLIIPGIWLIVPLYFINYFIIFDELPLKTAFSSSFELIKNNWWNSFILLTIFFAFNFILSTIVMSPLSLYETSISNSQDISTQPIQYGILGEILGVFNYFISLFPIIGMTFQFFNLKTNINLNKQAID